jgi:molybdenum cofactor biosynthesis protein B
MARIDESLPFLPVRIAIITVSDTRTADNDTSGDRLQEMIVADGHQVVGREILTDECDAIARRLRQLAEEPGVDVVITTGGTGVTGRDVTPEAFKQVMDKEVEGRFQLDSRHRPCNLVELMPRLQEHLKT